MRYLWVICLCLLCSQSYAYSKPNHKHITQEAIKLLNECGIDLSLDEKDVDTLIDLNLGQDGLTKKMVLWHFPMPMQGSANPEPSKKRAWLYGKLVTETTFDRWALYLDDQIRKEKDFKKRLPGIGALLHYAQDLAVPSHAIPIFHPSRIANSDKLDKWNKLQPNGDTLLPATKAICDTVNNPGLDNVTTFLTQVRTLTLNSLKKPLGQACQTEAGACNWSTYWSQQVEDNGFAHYGCNKKDVFGKKKFKCNGHKYQVDPEVYKTFAADRFQDATIASAQMLAYYYKHSSECQNKTPKHQWLPNKKLLKWIQKNY